MVDECQDLTGVEAALAQLRAVGAERTGQLALARALRVDALAGGAEIQMVLVEALDASLRADEAFVTWTVSVLDHGCGLGDDADHDAGVAASESASAAKQRLVGLWNPVAGGYGLAARTEDDV